MAELDRNTVLAFVRALVAVEIDASGEPIHQDGYIRVLLGRTWRAARSGGTRARCQWERGQDAEHLTDELVRLIDGEIEAEQSPGKCWVHAYVTGETNPCRTLSPILYEPTDPAMELPDTQGEALLRMSMELLKTNVTLVRDVRTMSRDQMELAYKLGEASAEARSGADAAQWEAMAAATPHFLGLAERLINQPSNVDQAENEDAPPEDPAEQWDWRAGRLDQHAAGMFGLIAQGKLTGTAMFQRVGVLEAKLRQVLAGIQKLRKQAPA